MTMKVVMMHLTKEMTQVLGFKVNKSFLYFYRKELMFCIPDK